jgi:hypothetical protein
MPEQEFPPASQDKSRPLVFMVRKETVCGDCGEDIFPGQMIRLEGPKGALCLSCADFDHLEFLAPGNAALTRRTTKYSRLHAVVLKWSSARKRYERQGILAEPEAIEKAEKECLSDADARESRRLREAERRDLEDVDFIRQFAGHILGEFPHCPPDEASKIARHACRKHSGRVGRSSAAKEFDPKAILLAVRAYNRHRHTDYEELFSQGLERHEARERVEEAVREVLTRWQ